MSESAREHVTSILSDLTVDLETSYGMLWPLVYEELRRLAAGYLRGERGGHTLQPTALVNEAYLKLVDHQFLSEAGVRNKGHFLGVAARAMRQVLVDHARRRRSQKRGGGRVKVTFDEAVLNSPDRDVDLSALDEALQQLEKLDERKVRVVELRFFAGMTNQEAAELLGVSPKTTEADWYFARAWLRRALSEESG